MILPTIKQVARSSRPPLPGKSRLPLLPQQPLMADPSSCALTRKEEAPKVADTSRSASLKSCRHPNSRYEETGESGSPKKATHRRSQWGHTPAGSRLVITSSHDPSVRDNALCNLEMIPLTLNQRKAAKIRKSQVDIAKRWNPDGLLSDAGSWAAPK